LGKNRDDEQMEALEGFIDQGLIDDVLGVIKSGKEATVYCCSSSASPGVPLVAAKVYRSLNVRTFRDDAAYRQGRTSGNRRRDRGMVLKTATGRKLRFAQWVADEYATLSILQRAGADVPASIACTESVILMAYAGCDEDEAAPPLAQAHPEVDEARRVFDQLLRNIELMLACNRVHADLSAYNVLYQAGRLWIIDFPQAVDPRFNASAQTLLERDIDRICTWANRYGVIADAGAIARRLWGRFLRSEL
jgi:RIO kinase 1